MRISFKDIAAIFVLTFFAAAVCDVAAVVALVLR